MKWKFWEKPEPATRELPAAPVQPDGAQQEWTWKAKAWRSRKAIAAPM